MTYIRGGGYQQHVSPQSPLLTNVNVTALYLPLIVDNVNIIRKRIKSVQLFIEVITLCPDRKMSVLLACFYVYK